MAANLLKSNFGSMFEGPSKAEKAFQPWWDTFTEHLVYGLIILGKGIISRC